MAYRRAFTVKKPINIALELRSKFADHLQEKVEIPLSCALSNACGGNDILLDGTARVNLIVAPGEPDVERNRSMLTEVGHVEAIFRYPVKSMAGERLNEAHLGWHGLDGDRRLAFRRMDNFSGMPWLTASTLPDLLLFSPQPCQDRTLGELPTHVRTPDGKQMPVFGEDLAAEVGRRYGRPVQMMQLRHGIFDEASISVIASDTVREIGRLAGRTLDLRRFRPNVVVRLLRSTPFQEDEWLGGVLSFGEGDDTPAITLTMRDERCSMVNLDPDSATPTPEVMKAVVRAHQNTAGIYGTVTRVGRLAVGQIIVLQKRP
jgi:uncharacterized protein YcbX